MVEVWWLKGAPLRPKFRHFDMYKGSTVVHITAALVQRSAPLAKVCKRVDTLVHITTTLIQGNTTPAMACSRGYTLVHITAAIVQGNTPCSRMYKDLHACTYHYGISTLVYTPLGDI